MNQASAYTVPLSQNFDDNLLLKGTWLVVLHASRIPPHIGLLIDGSYNSLNIKGQELDISINVLLKTIRQKKIESLFIQLKKHPVFSADYQKEICQHHIKKFDKVDVNQSCLLPVKLFLQEFYAVQEQKNELLFELVERLKQNNYIEQSFILNSSSSHNFLLPVYTIEQLQNAITTEKNNISKIHV